MDYLFTAYSSPFDHFYLSAPGNILLRIIFKLLVKELRSYRVQSEETFLDLALRQGSLTLVRIR